MLWSICLTAFLFIFFPKNLKHVLCDHSAQDIQFYQKYLNMPRQAHSHMFRDSEREEDRIEAIVM